MNSELDWFMYILDPNLLYENMPNMTDDGLVKLVRILLFHADRHAERNEQRNMNPIGNGELRSNGLLIKYDKSKTFDRLALMIAAHFRFNVNIFISDIPLKLVFRVYRSLVSSYMKRDEQLAKDVNLFTSSLTDAVSWNDMTPTLSYAAFAYHLWALQVSLF